MNDGGPAFSQYWWNAVHDKPAVNGGMTLRDYMATAAMQGLAQFLLLTPPDWSRPVNETEIAEQAYAMADAMLAARETKP